MAYIIRHSLSGSINGGYIPEDARSHISHLSQSRGPKSRATSIADLTGKPPYPGLGMGLQMSRPGKYRICQKEYNSFVVISNKVNKIASFDMNLLISFMLC